MQQNFDLAIVGAGISGFSACIEACKKKDKGIAVIDSSNGSLSNTYHAQGGIACAIGKKDSWKKHANDTIAAGNNLCNKKIVKIITSKGPKAIKELMDLGLNFDGDKKIELGLEGGHSERRILHINGDQTGKEILMFMKKIATEQRNATFFYNQTLQRIKEKKSKFLLETQELEISCNALIIATGGYAAYYEKTTNNETMIGKGIEIAYNIGCKITNMEFVQFHPTTFKTHSGKNFLLTEAIRGEGGKIVNEKEKEIINSLITRDKLSIEIQKEIEKGKKVFLDAKQISNFKERFPLVYKTLIENKINPTTEKIPIEPAAHYTIGGIKTNEKAMTNIKGLYAIGECSCSGFHGANRLASNSLLEGIVMGKIAAQEALKKVRQIKFKPKKQQAKIVSKIPKVVRKIMWNYCGVLREKTKLKEGLKKLKSITKKTKNEKKFFIGRATFEAALKRKNSIGAHFIEKTH